MAAKSKKDQESRGTSKRRGGDRRPRWWTWGAGTLCVLVVALLVLPTLLCTSPIVNRILAHTASDYGWKAHVSAARIGWLTPLQAQGIELSGPSGATHIQVANIQSGIRLIDLLLNTSDLGTILISEPHVHLAVREGASSLEEDIAVFQQTHQEPGNPGSSSNARKLRFQCSKGSITITAPHELVWQFKDIEVLGDLSEVADHWESAAKITAQLQDPTNQTGNLQVQVALLPPSPSLAAPWTAEIITEAMPLSGAQLALIRYPELKSSIPQQIQGTLSTRLNIKGDLQNQAIQAQAFPLVCQQLVLHDPAIMSRPYRVNELRIEGAMQWWQGNLRGDPVKVTTDFGSAELSGILAIDRLTGTFQDQLTSLAGDVDIRVDVAKFDAAFPGLIPLREDAQLITGTARVHAKSENDASGRPRLTLQADTDHIAGRAFQKQVQVPPTSFTMVLRPTAGWPTADKLELHSIFANASASGEMQNGNAQFDLDLARMAEFIKPLLDLPELQLDGQASGQMTWALANNQSWNLEGSANASRLTVHLPSGASLHEPNVEVTVKSSGIWQIDHLAELSSVMLTLNDGNQSWAVKLREPVQQPNSTSKLPLSAQGEGQLAALRQLAGPWLPAEVGEAVGAFQATVEASASANAYELLAANIQLREAAMVYNDQWYRPETVAMEFKGQAEYPSNVLDVKQLSVQSPAVALEARGAWAANQPPQFQANYRVDLRKLGETIGVQSNVAAVLAVRPASATTAITPAPTSYWMLGDLVGQAKVTGQGDQCMIVMNADINNLSILELIANEVAAGQILPANPPPPQILWNERSVHLEGNVQTDLELKNIRSDGLKLKTDWFESQIKGTASATPTIEAKLTGQTSIDTAILAQRLEPLIGQHIVLSGVHQGPIAVNYTETENAATWNASAEIGWKSGQLASIELGPAKIAVEANEQRLNILPTTIPMKNGKVQLAGKAEYASTPMTITVPPGLVVDNVQLDADLCRGWLKYVAPIVADATSVNGLFSLQLDQATFVPAAPEQSLVRGQLKIAKAELGPGPLSGVFSSLIETVKAASKGQVAQGIEPSTRQWIYLPEQQVEFALKQGIVEHRNLIFQSGNVTISTSGQVALDGRLSLLAKVPWMRNG